MSAPLEPRECPICHCEFTPTAPDQVYCSPLCERIAAADEKPG